MIKPFNPDIAFVNKLPRRIYMFILKICVTRLQVWIINKNYFLFSSHNWENKYCLSLLNHYPKEFFLNLCNRYKQNFVLINQANTNPDQQWQIRSCPSVGGRHPNPSHLVQSRITTNYVSSFWCWIHNTLHFSSIILICMQSF